MMTRFTRCAAHTASGRTPTISAKGYAWEEDGTNFYGAYQKDGQEVQFKVHYRHWEPMELILEQTRYNSCLMTEKHIPISSESMKCPQNPDPYLAESINIRDYNSILQEFHDYLVNTPHPEGRKGEWDTLIEMIGNRLP